MSHSLYYFGDVTSICSRLNHTVLLSSCCLSLQQILNEWYHENGLDKCSTDKPLTVSVSENDSIDFVKTNSSPGSSWAHMRRSSISSNGPTHSLQLQHTPQSQLHNSLAANSTPLLASRKLDISMGSAKKVSQLVCLLLTVCVELDPQELHTTRLHRSK